MENNTNKFFRVNDVIDAVEGTDWYHIAPDGHLAPGANGKTDVPLYKAADIQETLSLVPAIDLTEARMQTVQGFFEEVNLVLASELHKAFQHSYIAENEYIQRETRRAISSIMSALGQIEGKYIDGDIAVIDLALQNAALKAEKEKLTKENENLKVLTEMHNEGSRGMRSLYHEDVDALMATINARNKEIEELEEKLRLYKEVCGELVVKDHHAVGVLTGKETVYIPKNLAGVYKGMAVNIAKRATAKKILTDKVLIDHLERACGAGGKLALARIEEMKKEHEVTKVDSIPKHEVDRLIAEAKVQLVNEIISLIDQRTATNKEHSLGVQNPVWKGVHRGQEQGYRDIKEILTSRYLQAGASEVSSDEFLESEGKIHDQSN